MLFAWSGPSRPKKLTVIVALIVAGPVVVAVHVHGNATVAAEQRSR